jgi:sulfate transport system substrate-binding protein
MTSARPILPALAAVAATLLAAGCGGSSDSTDASAAADTGAGARTRLALVAYSTPQVVYDQVIPAFRRTAEGRDVGFTTSYGASGDQSRAVDAGQKADVVTFSTEPDMTRLVDSGLVAPTWDRTPTRGRVATSVVSFVVRRGNPRHIRDWDDLLRPGVKVLTPNPFTSGAAKWNLLAAYGAKGLPFVRELITRHVVTQDKSGREALQDFTSGTGDVLLSYEYEATTAQRKGEEVDYVTPPKTIRIDIDIAKTTSAPPAAQQFLDYVLSKPAQETFASWGYRPVDPEVLAANRAEFPDPPQLFTIDDLGGWDKVDKDLFDPQKGSIAKIEADAGVSTAK